MKIPFLRFLAGQKKAPEIQAAIDADYREPFRYGTFDESGYIADMKESTSKATLASLNIPEGTKPFRYPIEGAAYLDVYLKGKTELAAEYSRPNAEGKREWLCAELCYTNFELSGSLVGKLGEGYQRVGDIKNSLANEFSLKANIFLVIIVLIGGFSAFFAIIHYALGG